MASVYVLNCSSNALSVTLNGFGIGTIQGVASASSYQPNSLKVELDPSNYPQGTFGSLNKFSTAFQNIQGVQWYYLQITDPQDDNQLYVFDNYVVLTVNGRLSGQATDSQGTPAGSPNVPIAGQAAVGES